MRPVFVTLTAANYGLKEASAGSPVIVAAHHVTAMAQVMDKVTCINMLVPGLHQYVVETPKEIQSLIDKAFRTKRK